MSVRHMVLGLVLTLIAGCSASVDADGKVLTDRVWFDQNGVAHCPVCDPSVKLRAEKPKAAAAAPAEGEEAAAAPAEGAGIVKPHSNVCDAGHPVTWQAEDVVCWACDGAQKCPRCQGTGVIGKLACSGCIADPRIATEDGKGTGYCTECGGRGLLRWPGPQAPKTRPAS
jgi:hypothetical protein